jgi:hypothetical protein
MNLFIFTSGTQAVFNFGVSIFLHARSIVRQAAKVAGV